MKKLFLLFFFNHAFCIMHYTSAQNPLVKAWDVRYGGTDQDCLYSFQQTNDGGYILGGWSISNIGGDKTQNTCGNNSLDYWIIKIDAYGNKQWDKDFGGFGWNELRSVQQTADGGYILGGWSNSHISGNKTQDTWGDFDYWIVKTDSLGNKIWDKDFGGTNVDQLHSVHQTTDGGYILGGWSSSNISGNKTQNSWGLSDYWIVKTDSLGNKLWDKDFGGTNDDWIYSMQPTIDGGYILGGSSDSPISGDKTQNSWGGRDYWIVKTDSLGNKQWDKDFGGTDFDWSFSVLQTNDAGYILGGISYSNAGGDKTQNSWGAGDFWIVKTDSLGNKQWDKDFGGTDGEDEFGNIFQTTDGGYIIGGTSYSPISGNKTEFNLGLEQSWIINIDSLGNKNWDKTLFTPGHDEQGLAIQTRDGCYAVANFSDGGSGGYKTMWAWNNSWDFWVVKFCDTTQAPVVGFTTSPNLCPGTCADFVNLTFNATSYLWNFPGAVPNTSTSVNPTNICYANSGSYDVQLIATNANGSDTLLLSNYITVYPSPSSQSITQSGDTLVAIAGSSSYQWYYNGNSIPGATDYFYVATQSGDYNVVATDSNGCEVEAVINNVLAGLSPTLSEGEGVTAFPNPVTTTLDIRGLKNNSADEIKIFNVYGENVFSAVNCKLSAQSDPSFGGQIANCQLFPAGLYFIEITSGKKIYRAKFIKQ